MKNVKRSSLWTVFLLALCLGATAYGQIAPSGDAYTNTASATKNFGASALLDVESASQNTYIQFDLSSLPSGSAGANISKATLKLYVNAVTTAGSFNVDFVNGTWSEKTITADLSPALGSTIVSSVPLTDANVHDFVIIDITPALVAWLNGTETNDGIALVGNSSLNVSFDSKENTTTSHPPELDIVFAGGGTLTGVTTPTGSGLTGGGTSGTLNLALTNACAANQVLQWNGSAWDCAAVGTGTITAVNPGYGLLGGGTRGPVTLSVDTSKVVIGVNAGSGLVGGGTGGTPTLSVDPTQVPLLNAANNTFNGNQNVNGNLTVLNNANYQPLSVQSSSTFGTWLNLVNTSSGGKQWSILSAGGANGEGAGNLGITNFTGNSNIYLEGNVRANTLSVNNDTPMSHNPHMSFSGTFVGSLCNNLNCGLSSGSLWGAFIPDYNIVITRIMGTLNSEIDPSCLPANISVQAPNNQTYGTVSLPANAIYFDSGPISIAVPGGQFVELYPRIWGGCNFGASAGGDLYMNAQYVMQ